MARREHLSDTSARIAAARAKLTVASDRIQLNQEEYAQMQEEIVGILSKYFNLEFENDTYEIHLNVIYGTKRGVKDVKTIQIK